jgi:hypothetical protein
MDPPAADRIYTPSRVVYRLIVGMVFEVDFELLNRGRVVARKAVSGDSHEIYLP